MKYALAIAALLAGSAAYAQEPARVALTTDAQSMAALHPSTALETRITIGSPYSAEATTEFVQTLGDGSKISRKDTVRIFRDAEGRTRREHLGYFGEVRFVTINDPVAHVTYLLDPSARIAHKSPVWVVYPTRVAAEAQRKASAETKARTEMAAGERAAGGVAVVVSAEVPGQATTEEMRKRQVEMAAAAGGRGVLQAAVEGDVKEESLGHKVIDGVTTADGKRVTTILPAGSIGNQQPITVVAEQWFSPELEILVMTRHSDPRTGDTTYTVSNIARGDPGAALFRVPADYTIRDSGSVRTPAVR